MQEEELIPHLFRTEYRKIISVLCKHFGVGYIGVAEDIVSDTFLLAAETWGLKGLPKNPTAWLYTVSKNKVKDLLKHQAVFNNKVVAEVRQSEQLSHETEIDLSQKNIEDSQLQMMFAICQPSLTAEAQIGLSLSILCGFGVDQIADAFLSDKDTIYKRLSRAKEKLRVEKAKIELPPSPELGQRLETVLRTLYLVFSEGYYSTSQNKTLRKDLCVEAMRLTLMLIGNEQTNTPAANALLALMCFHSSRFEARTNSMGESILYDDQDAGLWSLELIHRGEFYLNRSSTGQKVSKYHLEAGIAYWHTRKNEPDKWEKILQLYNKLLQVEYSPMAALNRTYALAKANGVEEAIIEAEKLRLDDSHFYFALLGELYSSVDKTKAKQHFLRAQALAKSPGDRQAMTAKAERLS